MQLESFINRACKYHGLKPKDNLLDTLRILPKFATYVVFRMHYQETSYFWLQLGLRPDVNNDINAKARPLKILVNLPLELIDYIADYIPQENFLSRRDLGKIYINSFYGTGRFQEDSGIYMNLALDLEENSANYMLNMLSLFLPTYQYT